MDLGMDTGAEPARGTACEATDTFCQMLRRLIEERGLTVAQISQRFGVSRSAVEYWLTGANVPAADHVLGLAHLLGADVREFGYRYLMARSARISPGLQAKRGRREAKP